MKGVWNKIPFILSGGAGGPLAGTDPSTCFYHYFLVHVTNLGIKYELVRFNNTNSSIIDPDLVSNKGQEILKPVINTIGMQNTGLPVLGLIFAVLAIFGGLFISKWK